MSGWRQRGGDGGGKVAQVITPQEHNKFVGLAQLGYAGFYLLMMIVMTAFEAFMFRNIYSRSEEMGGALPTPFIVIMFVFIGFISLAMTVPSVVAGYALLKRRRWAKVAGIVGGVTAAMSFPIGTAVCVYALWFFLGDKWKEVYEAPFYSSQFPALGLNEAEAWDPAFQEKVRQPEYQPKPGDWR